MIPERCTFCKGTLHEGTAELIARVGDEIIVIRDVPALVCDRCGEAYYSAEVSQKIDAVMKDVHSGRLCCRPLAAGSAAGPSRQALLPASRGRRGRQARREARWLSDLTHHLPASHGWMRNAPPFFLHTTLTVSLFLFGVLLSSRKVTWMTNEKTTRELGLARRTGT